MWWVATTGSASGSGSEGLPVDRRKFFSVSGASAIALAAHGATAPVAQAANQARQPLKARLGHQIRESSGETLAWLARYGVEGVGASPTITDPSRIFATAEEMMRLRERVEKHGLTLEITDSVLLNSTLVDREPHPAIMLAQSPQRDRDIEAFQNQIRSCAAAGIPVLKYNMSILGVVRTGTTKGRGDSEYSTWRLKDAPPDQPLTRAGVVNADAYWERITYFLERVVPVANEYKVRLACHPPDPGMPPEGYRGVDTVLGTIEG